MSVTSHAVQDRTCASRQGADIFLFDDCGSGQILQHDAFAGLRSEGLRTFDSLTECINEAMDECPRLLILDVVTVDAQLQFQLQRLRSEHAGAHIPVVVRVKALTARDLSRLIQSGASDVVMATLPIASLAGRLTKILTDGMVTASWTESNLMAGVEHSAVQLSRLIVPNPVRVDEVKQAYGIDVSCIFINQAGAGGDLWDVFAIDKHRFGIVCADVCGHGAWATSDAIRVAGLLRSEGYDRGQPSAALRWLNQRLGALLPAGKFVAMAYAVINVARSEIVLSCSAHMPPLIRLPEQTWRLVESLGLPLGFRDDAQFDEICCAFPAGAQLLLHSDALVETPLPPGNEFTSESLAEFCNELSADGNMRAGVMARLIFARLQRRGVTLSDDLTLLTVERNP